MRSLFLLLLPLGYGRIIQQRDPEINPLFLDTVVSKIVENSLDGMRVRLRHAIYSVASKMSEDTHSKISSDNYSLEDIIAKTIKEKYPDKGERLSTLKSSEEVETHSHTMSIALETYTEEPIEASHGSKLITAHDLRLLDEPETPQASRIFQKFPLWPAVIGISMILTILSFISCIWIICYRIQRRKRRANIGRIPHPVSLAGLGYSNERISPGAYLERLRSTSSLCPEPDVVWATPGSLETILRAH